MTALTNLTARADRPLSSAAEVVALAVSQLQPADMVAKTRAEYQRQTVAVRLLRWAIASANHSTGTGHVAAAEVYFGYADQRFGWKIAQGEYGPNGRQNVADNDRIIVGISRGGRFALLKTSADTSRPIFERLAALAIVSPFQRDNFRRELLSSRAWRSDARDWRRGVREVVGTDDTPEYRERMSAGHLSQAAYHRRVAVERFLCDCEEPEGEFEDTVTPSEFTYEDWRAGRC